MIDAALLNYLEEQQRHRQAEEETRKCFIVSQLVLRYEEWLGEYLGGTFEKILHEELPLHNIEYHLRGEVLSKNRMLYEVYMPVEVLPFFMEVIHRIHTKEYPRIQVETEQIIRDYYWGDTI